MDKVDEHAQLRAFLSSRREMRMAERADREREAIESGAFWYSVDYHHDDGVAPSAQYEVVGGGTLDVRAGLVTIRNLEGHAYDYRVTISVAPELAAAASTTPDGVTTIVYSEGAGRVGPTVESLEVLRRRSGRTIGGRGVRGIKAGQVVEFAIRALSSEPIGGGSIREILRPAPKRRRDIDGTDLPVVVVACRAADAAGGVRLAAVQAGLKDSGLPCSEAQARKLIGRAVEAGMIPPGKRGRPARAR